MPSPTTISIDKLARLVGTPNCPALIDVRTDEDFAADPRLIPGAVRRAACFGRGLGAARCAGRSAIVICQRGKKLSEGVAAWLRHLGATAETLEGGHEAWTDAGLPAVTTAALPARDRGGPHGLGHAGTPKDRPHRLPLADPALRRSRRGLPVRRAAGGRGGRRSVRRHALRYRERVLEPSRRTVHLRRHGRGVRPGEPSRCSASHASFAAPTRHGPTSRRKPPDCSPFRSACRGCTPTTSRSSRPA